MPTETEFYDVVIFEKHDRVVTTLTGRRLPMSTGQFNAQRRLKTTLARIDSGFGSKIVPHDSCVVGEPLGAGMAVGK